MPAPVESRGKVFAEATPVPALPASVPVPPVPVAASTNEITILVFICKRTPRCPDPDRSLEWPFSPVPIEPEPVAAERTHVVVKGETLAQIAKLYYGDPKRWPEIAERNKITDPRTLQIGQHLSIP
jgi:nucleoid-associated protein YgaU